MGDIGRVCQACTQPRPRSVRSRTAEEGPGMMPTPMPVWELLDEAGARLSTSQSPSIAFFFSLDAFSSVRSRVGTKESHK